MRYVERIECKISQIESATKLPRINSHIIIGGACCKYRARSKRRSDGTVVFAMAGSNTPTINFFQTRFI